MSLIDQIRNKAANSKKRIILPEAEKDIRIIQAAVKLKQEAYADPVLLGSRNMIGKLAAQHGESIPDDLAILPYADRVTENEKYDFFKEKLKHKNPDDDQLKELTLNPLYTAGWMLATGRGDAAVAGSVASTGDVIVSALRTVGVSAGSGLVSSSFLMELPDGAYSPMPIVPWFPILTRISLHP
jgi:phosphotransacetylase